MAQLATNFLVCKALVSVVEMDAQQSSCSLTSDKYLKVGADLKISGMIANEPKGAKLQLSVVAQQRRVGRVVTQVVASDQQQQPTEMDKVLRMRHYADMKSATTGSMRNGCNGSLR